MKPQCIVMVGLPGLGKSTLIEKLGLNEDDVYLHSTDAFIEDHAKANGTTYDAIFADTIAEATRTTNIWLGGAIDDGIDVIWDQTNLGRKKREQIVRRMKQAGYDVLCYCIIPPEPGHISDQKVWARRLNNRPGKTIPENVMRNMIRAFTIPTAEEGFTDIYYFNMYGAEVDYAA